MKKATHWFQIAVLDMKRPINFYSTILSVEFSLPEAMGMNLAIFRHDYENGGELLYRVKGTKQSK